MRYVGNLRKENKDYLNSQYEKAVFPPGSSVPDMVSENSVMYNQRNERMNEMQSNMQPEDMQNNPMNNMRQNAENNDNSRQNREGETDSSFPLKNGETLRREDMGMQANNAANANSNMNMRPNTNQNPPMGYRSNMGFIYKRPSAAGCGSNRSVNDFLCEYMGKYISAEFLFGADTYVKKSGILSGMGMNYIVLDINGNTVICDLTDAKFINISTNDLI